MHEDLWKINPNSTWVFDFAPNMLVMNLVHAVHEVDVSNIHKQKN